MLHLTQLLLLRMPSMPSGWSANCFLTSDSTPPLGGTFPWNTPLLYQVFQTIWPVLSTIYAVDLGLPITFAMLKSRATLPFDFELLRLLHQSFGVDYDYQAYRRIGTTHTIFHSQIF